MTKHNWHRFLLNDHPGFKNLSVDNYITICRNCNALLSVEFDSPKSGISKLPIVSEEIQQMSCEEVLVLNILEK